MHLELCYATTTRFLQLVHATTEGLLTMSRTSLVVKETVKGLDYAGALDPIQVVHSPIQFKSTVPGVEVI